MADAIGQVMKALGSLEPAQRVLVIRACLAMCLQVHPELAEEATAKTSGAVRQERYRRRHAGASQPSLGDVTSDAKSVTGDVTSDVTGDAFPRHLGGGGESLSPVSSSSDLPSSEQISGSKVTDTAREEDGLLFPMTLAWELDEETRASAAMLGLRDVDAAWAAFRAENLDSRPRSRATWRAKFRDQWAVRAKRYEQADAHRGPSVRRPTLVVQPAGGAWKAGDGT